MQPKTANVICSILALSISSALKTARLTAIICDKIVDVHRNKIFCAPFDLSPKKPPAKQSRSGTFLSALDMLLIYALPLYGYMC